jgi:hypothetical protein
LRRRRRHHDQTYAAVVAGAGTVTLLFTDLVGSTESLVALGEDRFDSVRDEHEVLVGGTIAAYHGEIVKSMGDGYMAAFPRAGDAVGAAAEIQRLVARRNEGSEVVLACGSASAPGMSPRGPATTTACRSSRRHGSVPPLRAARSWLPRSSARSSVLARAVLAHNHRASTMKVDPDILSIHRGLPSSNEELLCEAPSLNRLGPHGERRHPTSG